MIQIILLESFLRNYQEALKIIKGSDFVFESVELVDYKLYSVHLRRGGSYIKSPEWLANKKSTIKLKKKMMMDACDELINAFALNYNKVMKKEFENILNFEKFEF